MFFSVLECNAGGLVSDANALLPQPPACRGDDPIRERLS
jgi:hypothetical protein